MSYMIIKNLDGDVIFDGEVRESHVHFAFGCYGNDISMANLRGVNLRGVDLSCLVLTDTNLSGADLSGADLSHCNLCDANLSGANLKGANLKGANLSYANFKGADLSSADLSLANMLSADLDGANLNDVNLSCCVGNSSEIKSLFIFDDYQVIYTAKYMQINETRCNLNEWFDAHIDDVVEALILIDSEPERHQCLEFWLKNRALLEMITINNPATKTGKE